jgi:Holliday junction resolvasome RuvABC ATP-dependent DNA helicase subunit
MTQIINQKAALRLLAIGARSRSSVLIVGGPGQGKTTLALHYLRQFDRRPLVINAGSGDSASVLKQRSFKTVLIDEAHKLRNPEALYPWLDDPGGFLRSKKVFALATTDQGKLPGPLISRLMLVALERYTLRDLAAIATLVAPFYSEAVRLRIAQHSHGNPRRVKLLTQLIVKSNMRGSVDQILEAIGYRGGLNAQERALIRMLGSGPKSISTLAGLLGVGKETVRLIESDLIASGLLMITSRGRELI